VSGSDLEQFFEERLGEIGAYVGMLQDLEDAARSGPPRLEGAKSPITVTQQRILYSSVYLQLYNLVEATVSRCLEAVTQAAASNQCRPMDLNESLLAEWIRVQARTHAGLSPENRLKSALAMCNHLIQQLPIDEFTLEVGGGNWDDEAIEKVSRRVGFDLTITKDTLQAVKKHVRNELGALKLVKNRRNGLAHGSLSFVDCSDGVSVSELKDLASAVGNYLREATACFTSYIAIQSFLRSSNTNPAGVA
jgi:MAE_28990/MAE_18760-like HEPN